MHPDVQSLLALQQDDLAIYGLQDRLAALAPRLAALEKERGAIAGRLDRSRNSVQVEEAKHRDALHKHDANKALVDRSQRAYEAVTSPKEANAAVAQLDQTKRMLAESERDVAQSVGAIEKLRHEVAELESAVADVEARQSAARSDLETEKAQIDGEMETASAKRQQTATSVNRPLLTKYDKVRLRKRSASVFALRSFTCSSCDTAIPTQRRAAVTAGSVELCEGCGVLLYAAE